MTLDGYFLLQVDIEFCDTYIMNFKSFLIMFHFLSSGFSNKFLVKTRQKLNKTDPEIVIEETHNDYMAELDIQSVDVGSPVELKCSSPKEFSRCFFSKDGKVWYTVEPKVSHQNDRLQCLCDVSLEIISINKLGLSWAKLS